MFKKILLPTDGSRHSLEAAKIAGDLAASQGGAVCPLVAVEYQYLTGGDLPEELVTAVCAKITARAEKALHSTAVAIQERGGAVLEGKVSEGEPETVILREADQGEYDLIVIGSQGVSTEDGRDRLLGSVAERVLHRAPCPVLVIRAEPKP